MPLFIIEHLEPKVYPWCKLEYSHISSVAGKENLLITNVSSKTLANIARVEKKKTSQLSFDKACVLDPEAEQTLTPETAKQYKTFIFGGILGDYPPRKRTKEELVLSYPRFNLGKEQMSTDTAVIVTKMIIDGKKLEEMKFQEGIEVEIKEGETVQLPYKYLVVEGKPLLPKGLVELLKKRKGF